MLNKRWHGNIIYRTGGIRAMFRKASLLLRGNNDVPPNLDEILNSFFKKKTSTGSKNQDDPSNAYISSVFLIIIAALWFLSGFLIVKPAEESVVLRFGKYSRVLKPGLHWLPRVIDSYQTVNVEKIYDYQYQANMLTADENIVDIEVNIQYRVEKPREFLFNSTNPVDSVNQSTASALRQIIGETSLDQILTVGRLKVRDDVREQLIDILNIYNIGIMITDVRLQAARPPSAVKAAFDDAVKAREDEQRYINEAKAYDSKITPIAQGKARRVITEAEAYRDQVILQAKAKTAIYNALIEEYLLHPDVIRTSMYYRGMETVMKKTPKLLLNIDKSSNSFIYLPLEQLVNKANKTGNLMTLKDSYSIDNALELETKQQPYGVEYQRNTWRN